MLQSLLHEGALFPVFQPIVDLRQGTVFGHEALIRGPVNTPWHSPVALLGLAAAESRQVEFELHCVEVILRHWQILASPGRLFLNMGPDALIAATHGARPDWLERTFGRFRVKARCLTVEITEQQAVRDMAALQHAMTTLRTLGASVALDDLGEGHSSLQLWTMLKPDIVKIDKFLSRAFQVIRTSLSSFVPLPAWARRLKRYWWPKA